jgi:hypothetical protein|tara:strand:+ start:305 stop:1000 length:696 start_codon:yes stop_codon:yes gene_type:complete
MFFGNKLKVLYNSSFEEDHIKNCIKKMPYNLPTYFKNIPHQMFNPELKKFLPFLRTVKTCPGYVNLFKHSLLICNPVDSYIQFNDHGIEFQKHGAYNDEKAFAHPNDHLLKYVPNKHNYKFIIKYCLPFSFKSNVAYISMDPGYHFSDHKTLPGIVPSNWFNEYNIFIPIHKDQKELYIKQGEPLSIIVPLTEKKVSLRFKERSANIIDKSIGYKFSNFKKFLMKDTWKKY